MDQNYVYATAAVIATYLVCGMFRKSFDPFAPVWLFLAGYAQVYVVQAISYREYALRVRGLEVVTAGQLPRALGAASGSCSSTIAGPRGPSRAGFPGLPSGGRSPWSRPSRRS